MRSCQRTYVPLSRPSSGRESSQSDTRSLRHGRLRLGRATHPGGGRDDLRAPLRPAGPRRARRVRDGPGDEARQITGVGDVFTMAMHFPALGDYEMDNHVVEFELDRRIAWEPAPGHGHPEAGSGGRWGHRWRFELAPDGPDATVVTETYDSRAPRRRAARPRRTGVARRDGGDAGPARGALPLSGSTDRSHRDALGSFGASTDRRGFRKWHSITPRRRCWRSSPSPAASRCTRARLKRRGRSGRRSPRCAGPASPHGPSRGHHRRRRRRLRDPGADPRADAADPRGDRVAPRWRLGDRRHRRVRLARRQARRTDVVRRRPGRLPPRAGAPLPHRRRRLLGRPRVGGGQPRRPGREPGRAADRRPATAPAGTSAR